MDRRVEHAATRVRPHLGVAAARVQAVLRAACRRACVAADEGRRSARGASLGQGRAARAVPRAAFRVFVRPQPECSSRQVLGGRACRDRIVCEPSRFSKENTDALLSLLRAALPDMPQEGRIPRMWVGDEHKSNRAHYIEHPRSASPKTDEHRKIMRQFRGEDEFPEDKIPPPSNLVQRARLLRRAFASCIPKRPAKPDTQAKEYVDKVDEAAYSFFVQAVAPPQNQTKLVVPGKPLSMHGTAKV